MQFAETVSVWIVCQLCKFHTRSLKADGRGWNDYQNCLCDISPINKTFSVISQLLSIWINLKFLFTNDRTFIISRTRLQGSTWSRTICHWFVLLARDSMRPWRATNWNAPQNNFLSHVREWLENSCGKPLECFSNFFMNWIEVQSFAYGSEISFNFLTQTWARITFPIYTKKRSVTRKHRRWNWQQRNNFPPVDLSSPCLLASHRHISSRLTRCGKIRTTNRS